MIPSSYFFSSAAAAEAALRAWWQRRRYGAKTPLGSFARRWVVAFCAAALLAGCQGTNEPAPASRFVVLDGSSKTSADFKGKVWLVNFWATSCTTCVAEMPEIVGTYQKYKSRGFDTVAVAMQYDPPSFVVNFAKQRQLPFWVALDNTGQNAQEWGGINATPTTFLIDKQGRIVKRIVGKPDFAQLHAQIEALL